MVAVTSVRVSGGHPRLCDYDVCCGLEFPPYCKFYRGPHSIECISSIWEASDCAVEGYENPQNISENSARYAALANANIE